MAAETASGDRTIGVVLEVVMTMASTMQSDASSAMPHPPRFMASHFTHAGRTPQATRIRPTPARLREPTPSPTPSTLSLSREQRFVSRTCPPPTSTRAREVRLLVDHREDLIAERTRHINRLRWHLHEIDPTWGPKQRALTTMKHLAQTQQRLAETTTAVAKIAAELVERIRALTIDINALEDELDQRTTTIAPTLREVHGVAAVSAAKFIGEVAGIGRMRRHAFAPHNGTAPTPVWSGNSERHRLSREAAEQAER